MATFDAWLPSNDGLLRLIVNPGTQDIANNRTYIYWSLTLINNQGTWTRYAYGIWYWSVAFSTTPGVYLGHGSGQDYNLGPWAGITLGAGEGWIEHHLDGTRSDPYTGAFTDIPTYGWFGSGSVSGTVTMNRIYRGPRVKSGGAYKHTIAYVKSGGVWKIAIPYVKSGGVWKIGGG